MKRIHRLLHYLYTLSKQFYKDESGVYMYMGGMLAIILLGLAALAVDGSGIYLDKARFVQAMDQGALSLATENNTKYRKNKAKHADVNRQVLGAEYNTKSEDEKFAGRQYMRNQELTQGLVKVYMRSYNKVAPNDPSLPIRIEKDFNINCEEVSGSSKNQTAYEVNRPIVCELSGEIKRKSWLPLDNKISFGKEVDIASGVTYGVKDRGIVIPIDLVMVNDLSGSMYENANGNDEPDPKKQKIQDLREVTAEVANILIPDTTQKGVSPYNRIGIVTFGLGAQQKNYMNKGENNGYCNLPYSGNERAITVGVYYGGKTPPYQWKGKWRQDKMCNTSELVYQQFKAAGFMVQDWKGNNFDVNRAKKECQNKGDGKPYSQMYVSGKNTDIIKHMLHNLRPAHYGYGQANEKSDKYFYAEQKTGSLTNEIDAKTEANIKIPFVYAFYSFFDYDKTLKSIDALNGTRQAYPLFFEKNDHCLGKRETTGGESGRGDPTKPSTDSWFGQSQKSKLNDFMNKLKPEGSTLASSGMLIGANLLMDKNQAAAAQPGVLGVNTQRILLVMSDGKDTVLTHLTKELQERGMCERIKARLDTLQDKTPGIKQIPAKVAFVMFGNQKLNEGHKNAWLRCVGSQNYYEAKNKTELLNAFRQIISIDEEVGKISIEKP